MVPFRSVPFRSVPFLLSLVSFLISGCLLDTPSTERKAIDCKENSGGPTSCFYLNEYGKAGDAVLIKSDDYKKYGITDNTYPARVWDGSSIEKVCVNLQGNSQHCGVCGNVCNESVKHAEDIRCTDGKCTYGKCNHGFLDRNGDTEDGCEVDTRTNIEHCEGKSNACNDLVVNAEGIACVNGKCSYKNCNAGFLDLDGNRSNGCEVDTLTSIEHCGEKVIDCNKSLLNAKNISCNNGVCDYQCKEGFLDRDGDESPGCEVDTRTNVEHCRRENYNCHNLVKHADGVHCNNGKCGFAQCKDGFADFDNDPRNGCEARSKDVNPNACGESSTDCTTYFSNVNQAYCYMGTCVFDVCKEGYAGDELSRGCPFSATQFNEWYGTLAPTNCGGVNCYEKLIGAARIRCSPDASGQGGRCAYDHCIGGFADMDNDPSNGCESFYKERIKPWSCGSDAKDCFEVFRDNIAKEDMIIRCKSEWGTASCVQESVSP